MTSFVVSMVIFVVNFLVVLFLLARYYIKVGEAREEAAFWRGKAERLDKPVA